MQNLDPYRVQEKVEVLSHWVYFSNGPTIASKPPTVSSGRERKGETMKDLLLATFQCAISSALPAQNPRVVDVASLSSVSVAPRQYRNDFQHEAY
jgi:hypothetical protein